MKDTIAVIGALNEQETIHMLINELLFTDFIQEVIVINGGSTDTTVYLAGLGGATVIKLDHPTIAEAYKYGLTLAARSNCQFILQMDAGGTHLVRDAHDMHKKLRMDPTIDLIIGARDFHNSFAWRRLISQTAACLCQKLCGNVSPDVTSGFRLWRKELLQRVLASDLEARYFAFQIEMLYYAAFHGGQIAHIEIPYLLTNSSFRWKMVKEGLQTVWRLFRLGVRTC